MSDDGRENYHLVAYDLPELPLEAFYNFRRALGDDVVRVWLDEECHGKPEQVLFSRRVPLDTGKPRWRTRVWDILWKPFWSKLPSRKPVSRKLKHL